MLTAPTRRMPQVLTLMTAAFLLVVAFATPASAEPNESGGAAQATLRAELDKALAAYNDAKGRLDQSVVNQAQVTENLAKTQTRLTELEATAGSVASAAYRGKRMNMAAAVLDAKTPEAMLHTALTVQYLVTRDDRQLRELKETRKKLEEQQAQLANEIRTQQEQLAIMEKNKKTAEDALKKAGGGAASSGPTGGRVTAPALKRNPDGSWPSESCTIRVTSDMRIGSGCVSPRTWNAVQEARKAGYERHTNCYRSGEDGGDHPRGKACDLAAFTGGFENKYADGANKTYGDNLAAWCVANAGRIGVKYVIWWNRIWQPGTGWKSYGGGSSAAGGHYNHVHLSMQ